MHKIYLLFLCSFLCFNSLDAQIPNGFYVGETCELKEAHIVYYNTPLKIQVDKPLKFKDGYIHSSNNKNDLHRISLEVEKVPENTWLVLKIDDSFFATCLRSRKKKKRFGKLRQANDPELKVKRDTSASKGGFVIEKRSDADIISKFLKIDIVDRQHFGHQIAATLKTQKAKYTIGDSILLDFSLINTGKVPLKLDWDTWQKGTPSTTNKFRFKVTHNGKVLKKNKSTNSTLLTSASIPSQSELLPNDHVQRKVNLGQWFDFKTPGKYFVSWNYRMQLTDARKPFDSKRSPEFYWNDEVKGSFVLVIQ